VTGSGGTGLKKAVKGLVRVPDLVLVMRTTCQSHSEKILYQNNVNITLRMVLNFGNLVLHTKINLFLNIPMVMYLFKRVVKWNNIFIINLKNCYYYSRLLNILKKFQYI